MNPSRLDPLVILLVSVLTGLALITLRVWVFAFIYVASIVVGSLTLTPDRAESAYFGLVLAMGVYGGLILAATLALAAMTRAADREEGKAAAAGRMVVGLSGYAGAGKDTAAKGLLWAGYTRVSFADKLREFTYAQNPYIAITDTDPVWLQLAGDDQPLDAVEYMPLRMLVDWVGWDVAKDDVKSVRELLQRTGTDAGRKVLGENVWVDAVMNNLPAGDVVVTDVRFPNEANAVKDSGLLVRIERDGVEPVNGHVSEYALDGYPHDVYMHNNGDEHEVGKRLRDLAAKWPRKT